jgi:hypothetical protein
MRKRLLSMVGSLVLAAGLTAAPASAASYSWVENNGVNSTLTTEVYSTSGNTATLAYTGQTITNTGAPVGDAGMYMGWVWAATSAASAQSDWSGYTPMPWDNVRQAFYNADFGGTGSDVSMQVQSNRPVTFLSLATVGDPTGTGPGWTGTPWSYALNAPAVTTNASMGVPFIDFGPMATNEVKTYDISFVFTFSDAAGVRAFNDFYVGAQGVSAVPLPAAAWSGLALLGVLGVKKVVGKTPVG